MPFFLMKAIILAGGKGSRFAPITDKIPKALIPVNGKTLLERVICSLPDSIDTIIVTTKYLGNLIEKSIGNEFLDKKVIYTKQDELSEGTWPALFSTRNLVRKDEFFCVLNTDDIFDKNEIDKILQKKEVGMGITKKILPAKYHGVRFDNNNFFIKFERHENENREFLVEDFFANGFFLLNGEVFDSDPQKLIDGEFGLPQTVTKSSKYSKIKVFKMDKWLPCNTFEDLDFLTKIFK